LDTAIDMLLYVIGGLMLGIWLYNEHGASAFWVIVLPILGMLFGLWTAYKRSRYKVGIPRHPKKNAGKENADSTMHGSPLKNWQPYDEDEVKGEYDDD
jgi:F0F1-type ATP synthase assembly protein I